MKFLEYSAVLATVAAAASASSPTGHHERRGVLRKPNPASFPKAWDASKRQQLPKLPNTQRVEHGEAAKPLVKSAKLQDAVKAKALRNHAENLEAIAYQTTGRNRVFGSPGHNFTALYIYQLLEQLDEYYTVSYQPFKAFFSAGSVDFKVDNVAEKADFMTYSPSGTVAGALAKVANLGCNATDYAGVSGKVALISRGSCEFGLKSALAGSAGATAAIIYNNINGTLSGTLGPPPRPEGAYVPTAGISLQQGQALVAKLAAGPVNVNVKVDSVSEDRVTMNVIAQTKGGDQRNVIMVGAHADSVQAGPGINDNGSGSIALLEIALQLAKYRTNNAVRFAWWSAEEFGLLGSEYYVFNGTSDEDLNAVRLYLNFDMIASPNYFYGIYDGDGSAFNISGPPGSAEAEKLFADYFKSQKIPSQPTEFSGRSDYGPFLDANIAAGGLFTGAEVLKKPEEVKLYGGQAGVAYDVNYHGAGDTVANLNFNAFMVNSKAIAHSIATYATSFATLPAKTLLKKRDIVKRGSWKEKRGLSTVNDGCMHKHVAPAKI